MEHLENSAERWARRAKRWAERWYVGLDHWYVGTDQELSDRMTEITRAEDDRAKEGEFTENWGNLQKQETER